MSNGDGSPAAVAHVALLTSAGMGHLNPFLRLAAMLASRNFTVTLVTAKTTVSAAESAHVVKFFATFPHIRQLELEILPYDPPGSGIADPFFLQFEAINSSVHLLRPLLSSCSPPLSAIISDITIIESVTPLAADLSLPNYVVWTSSARFLSVCACVPEFISETSSKFDRRDDSVEIPGLPPVPISAIPPPFFNHSHSFSKKLRLDALFLDKAKGLVVNSFEEFEPEAIAAINGGKVLSHIPPVIPLGPFETIKLESRRDDHLPWLDDQSAESVVYVSFGSRTALSRDQIRELGSGLERSGCKFIWALKSSKVDKEDTEKIGDLLGDSFLERTKDVGIIAKNWVNQEGILSHPATGLFVSHCGWNSVMEAARHGVPVVTWAQHGDQQVNSEVVERAGLGVWMREWGWGGEKLVSGEEIGEKIREMMSDEKLKRKARKIGEEARKAWESGGSSEKALMGVIEAFKH